MFHGVGKDRSGNSNCICCHSQFILHTAIRMVFEKSHRILLGSYFEHSVAVHWSFSGGRQTPCQGLRGPVRSSSGLPVQACFVPSFPYYLWNGTQVSFKPCTPALLFLPPSLCTCWSLPGELFLPCSPRRLVLIPQISAQGPLFQEDPSDLSSLIASRHHLSSS